MENIILRINFFDMYLLTFTIMHTTVLEHHDSQSN